jgi:hypothetical protein
VISLECTTGPTIMKDLLYIFCKNSKIELTKSDYISKASIIAWERTTAAWKVPPKINVLIKKCIQTPVHMKIYLNPFMKSLRDIHTYNPQNMENLK